MSIKGETQVDRGASTCESDTTSQAIAVNDSQAVAPIDSKATAVNGSFAGAFLDSRATAINTSEADALDNCTATAQNGEVVRCPILPE